MPPTTPNNKAKNRPSGSRRKQSNPTRKAEYTVFHLKSKHFKVYKTTLDAIKYLQRSTKLLIPKLRFARLVREIYCAHSEMCDKIQTKALEALQEASEIYLTHLFEDANMLAMHAKRVTLTVEDLSLALQLRE